MSVDPMEGDDMANIDLEVHAQLIVSKGFAGEITGTSYTNVTEKDLFEMVDLSDVFLNS